MRRLALLLAGGALWLLFMAAPAFADGGPHTIGINSGTSGLNGDCAACHRAHTAQAADLLKASMPGLCLTCHDGTGATTNVEDGIQYVPDGSGDPTGTVLGALRGGGFQFALIDTGDASRMTYNRSGGARLTYASAPAAGSITLTWPAVPSMSFAGGSVSFAYNASAATIQTAIDGLFGTSTVYSGSTAAQYMSGLPSGNRNVLVTVSGTQVNFAFHNAWRTVRVPLPTVDVNTTGVSTTVTDTTTVSATAAVGVLASGEATTSMHEGAGTVWGNGAMGTNTAGATGVELECTGCHNPHGNGQYRILNAQPGEDWTGLAGVVGWVEPAAVEVVDGPALTAGQVRNYTVLPGELTTDADNFSATQGDYLRRKYDPTGAANFTNFYLVADPMTIGWNGQSPTNAAAVGTASTTLTAALTASGTTATVASTAGMPTHLPSTEPQPVFIVQVDSELMTVTRVTNATTLTITRGYGGTTAAAHNSGATFAVVQSSRLYNNLGRMTAWCITCHTRYNGWAQNGTSSLVAQTPPDTMYAFKHGTTGIGCEMCHVSHGSNATMTAQFSSQVLFPDGSLEDSALLKVNNRGTCNLCHDPTGSVDPGVETGTVPGAVAPGP